ncbi:MAG: DUF1349 domain-containing protein, partial [Chloroflexi bacterium]|nr:DUF1349 domain-containing protein [Chloroflexota bacterium]
MFTRLSFQHLLLPVALVFVGVAIFLAPNSTVTATSWINADIGNVGVAGSADETNGTFTIQASGENIWGQSDDFHYVYQPLNGDGEISGLVSAPQSAENWAMSGLMIRESLSADSAHVMVRLQPTGLAWTARRSTTGANTGHYNSGFSSDPHWLRLVRVGNTISSYRSDDGQTWTLLQSINITMGQNVYIGMAVTAFNNSSLTTATFDNISVSGGVEPTATPTATTPGSTPTVTATATGTTTATSWTSTDIGNVGLAGSADETNGTFTVQASGIAIWGQNDGFHYVYQPLNGDGEISGLVAAPQNTGPWAFAGLMIRESLSADSVHVMVRARSDGSVWTAQRSTTGANTSQTDDGFSSDPHWLRLVRAGNTISSYRSDDGQTWTLLQSINITMGQNVYIGMAVTAFNNSSLTTAIFNNISVSGGVGATPTPTATNTATATATATNTPTAT